MDLIKLYEAAKFNISKIVWVLAPPVLLLLMMMFTDILVLLFDGVSLLGDSPKNAGYFFIGKLAICMISSILFMYLISLTFYRTLSMMLYKNGKEYIVQKFNEKFKNQDLKSMDDEYYRTNVFAVLEPLIPQVLFEFFKERFKDHDWSNIKQSVANASDANATTIVFKYIDEHFADEFSIQNIKYLTILIFFVNTVLVFWL